MQQLGLPTGQASLQFTPLPRRAIHPSLCPRLPPPAIALASAPVPRTTVVAHAKRGSKRSKAQEPEGDSEGGWDAALSGIPTEDEASDPGQEPSTAAQEPPAQPRVLPPRPGKSRPTGRGNASGSLSGLVNTSLPQTTMTLREFQLLMEAKAAKEAREEAERKAAEAARLAAEGFAIVAPGRRGAGAGYVVDCAAPGNQGGGGFGGRTMTLPPEGRGRYRTRVLVVAAGPVEAGVWGGGKYDARAWGTWGLV